MRTGLRHLQSQGRSSQSASTWTTDAWLLGVPQLRGMRAPTMLHSSNDGCYDWAAAVMGARHYSRRRIPALRLRGLCHNGVKSCYDWIGGRGASGTMAFPTTEIEEGCRGKCPPETGDGPPAATDEYCLPDVTVIDRQQLLHKEWTWAPTTSRSRNSNSSSLHSVAGTGPIFRRGDVRPASTRVLGPLTWRRCAWSAIGPPARIRERAHQGPRRHHWLDHFDRNHGRRLGIRLPGRRRQLGK